MSLTPMDIILGALFNAYYNNLTLDDVCDMACNAETPNYFDRAVNMLAMATPQPALTKPSRKANLPL